MLGTAKRRTEPQPILTSIQRDNSVNCLVAKGTKIEGIFKCQENVRMDGEVLGEVTCEGKLVMGNESKVEGDLSAVEAVIMGMIKGNLSVSGILHLTATARIEGTIKAHQMVVDEGASYSGECHIGTW